jgi:hypothetical protein
MSDLTRRMEVGRAPEGLRSRMRAGWGPIAIAMVAVILVNGCVDLPTGFEPEWCSVEERAPLLGHPYHEWPDRYFVRFRSDVDPNIAAPELAGSLGFEIGNILGLTGGFSAEIPARSVALLRCDPRVEWLEFVGPPFRIGWYGGTIVRD